MRTWSGHDLQTPPCSTVDPAGENRSWAAVTTHLVSFATPDFAVSLRELSRTARRFGIRHVRAWSQERLRRTPFHRQHRSVLDQPRGAGYWLWKPYIIGQALDDAAAGDIVAYSDSGISVIAPLQPLFDLSRRAGGILLFRGTGECRQWTKRDCFVFTGCDEPRYHNAPMASASCLLLVKSNRSRDFVAEWLESCADPRVLTDSDNNCGLANLPGFVDHRHDQAVLSLLAARHGLELFRSPTQFGNHGKPPAFRQPGEWLLHPYDDPVIYTNSPYGTLLFHHRKRSLGHAADQDRRGCRDDVVDSLIAATAETRAPVRLLHIGDGGDFDLASFQRRRSDCRLLLQTDRLDEKRCASLKGAQVNLVVSHTVPSEIASEQALLARHQALDKTAHVWAWTNVEGLEGWAAFRAIRDRLHATSNAARVLPRFGWTATSRGRDRVHTLGIIAVLDARTSA
jgi:hypothetical protein